MSSSVISFPEAPAPTRAVVVHGASAPENGLCLVRRRATVLAQIDGMRARGMSDTGIRRALGLSERQAVDAGIVPLRQAVVAAGAPPIDLAGAVDSAANTGPTQQLVRRHAGPLMAEVLAAVARLGEVGRDEIVGPSQGRRLTPLRQLTMYVLRELCGGASLPAIGHFLSRDHTTVHYGCRKAEQRLNRDPDYRCLYDAIRGELTRLAQAADG